MCLEDTAATSLDLLRYCRFWSRRWTVTETKSEAFAYLNRPCRLEPTLVGLSEASVSGYQNALCLRPECIFRSQRRAPNARRTVIRDHLSRNAMPAAPTTSVRWR